MAGAAAAQSIAPYSAHSVTTTTASAPRSASSGGRRRPPATGSARWARRSARGSWVSDIGAGGPQVGGKREGRGLADIVGVGLERESELRDPAAGERAGTTQQRLEAGHDLALVDRVRAMDRRQERGVDVERGGLERDRDRLLGQARAADAGARLQERRADPGVEADPGDDGLDVGAGRIGDPGHLVGERDLGPEEDVRTELDQRDRPGVGDHRRRAERRVQVDDGLGGGLVTRLEPAGDDPVRAIEVLERLALAHELGVGHDRRAIGAIGRDGSGRQAAGTVERQRRADDDHVVGGGRGQEAGDRRLDVDRRERPVRVGRRAHAHERERRVGGRVELGREGERAGRPGPRPGPRSVRVRRRADGPG